MALSATNGALSSLTNYFNSDAVKAPIAQTSAIAKLQKQDDSALEAANEQKNTAPTGTPNVNARRGSYVNVVV